MGGGIFDPGGTGITQGAAPAPAGTLPGAPPNTATYLKLVVPNFNGGGSSQPQMGSYLRLGATEPDIPPGVATPAFVVNGIDPTGEDLAALVQGFADDLRIRQTTDVTEMHTRLSADNALIAAARAAGQTPQPALVAEAQALQGALDAASAAEVAGLAMAVNAPAQQTLPLGTNAAAPDPASGGALAPLPGTVNNRLAESAVLHKKGGWRDHSDGNRITTTRGDKVEVIRGNYKMVILGRQELSPLVADSEDDFEDWATGLDESGGLSDNQDQTRGVNGVLALTYNWEPDSDGRWGWTQKTVTGVFDDSATALTGTTTQANGRQIAVTWVDEVQSFLGGPNTGAPVYSPLPPPPAVSGGSGPGIDAQGNKRVNRIYNRTWVNVLDEMTDAAGSITEVVQSGGDMSTTTATTAGGSITNHISASGEIQNHTTCSSDIYETTTCRSLHSTFDIAPFIFNLALATIITEIKSVVHLDIHAGAHFDMHVLDHFDYHVFHQQYKGIHEELSLENDQVLAVQRILGSAGMQILDETGHTMMVSLLKVY